MIEIPAPNQQTVRLPDVLKFVLSAPHALLILQALGELAAPHKQVHPVLANFEQQILGQQILGQQIKVGLPPPASAPGQETSEPDLADGL